jgi:hypothetical protein
MESGRTRENDMCVYGAIADLFRYSPVTSPSTPAPAHISHVIYRHLFCFARKNIKNNQRTQSSGRLQAKGKRRKGKYRPNVMRLTIFDIRFPLSGLRFSFYEFPISIYHFPNFVIRFPVFEFRYTRSDARFTLTRKNDLHIISLYENSIPLLCP